VHTGDELETLAERFNAMAGQLSESYSTLEQKVEDRTAALSAALAQQTATSEILKVISSSPTDVQPVFEAIVRAARDLGQADAAYAFLFDGTHIVYVTSIGATGAWLQFVRERPPWKPNRSLLTGRVVLDQANVRIEDKLADPGYEHSGPGATTGRRLLGVPMFREGKVIGVLTAMWQEPGPVPEKLEYLLQTFAAQAVIAIENVRLFQELGQRNADLSETLEQQTATAEILRVISSSPTDVTPVFQAISNAARELGGAQEALVARYDGEFLSVAASTLNAPEDIERRKSLVPWKPDRTTLSGRVVMDRAPVEIPDIRIDSAYDRRYLAEDHPNRRALGVPMLREGEPVGALNIWWGEPGEVQPKFVRLLQTFADQAVIAVENVRLFNEIQDKSRQLEAANRHKSEFLANMSHELRTPLNAIIGFSDVMLSGMTGALEEKPKEFIGDIRDSGKHLLHLINDILDLSKIEAGRMDLDVSRFDLRSAIDNAITLVKGRADRHGIQLETRIAPEVEAYDGDERKFKQIVLNLMSNAVKFTPEGGKVTLSAARANGAYEIAVTDTGIGIAPEDQLVIFEEFRQVGSDYARKAEGTGLGLTLTRRLVELHGGTLAVRSAPGQGSTFTFTLPIGSP